VPPGFWKGDEDEKGLLHYFARILLAMKGREKKGNNHTTRVYDLSELVAPWLMSVSFLYQASGLFIAPDGRRDNYKREFKKEK
jgi:hypothetical protein